MKFPIKALALAIASISCVSTAFAEDAPTPNKVQRVEVTGSSIKRIVKEGALPVQQITKEEIARSGATNVAELLQNIPAMQGFQVAATAAGTNSGGSVYASLHDIGQLYTLVLLNGRRIAPQGSGSTVNLNAIPMSALERIEVLTDGASAIYGSDAIAGVINFITKKNLQGGQIEGTYNAPQQSGGGSSWDTSFTYGFGNLDENNFNALITYRHDEQAPLKAKDRDFAKTSYLPVSHNGKNYIFDKTSPSSIPANATVQFNDAKTNPNKTFNPGLLKTGNCGELNFPSLSTKDSCGFDFVNTIEIYPESKRDTLFVNGKLKVNDNLQFFGDIALSRYDLTARIAPNAVSVTIDKNSAYYKNSIAPFLSTSQAADVKKISATYRMYDWGTRDSQTLTDSNHFVAGAEGDLNGWSWNTALTWSRNELEERYVGGYVKDTEFRDMLKNGSFDPFAPIGTQSDATKQLIKNSLFNGSVRTASTTLQGVDAKVSSELFTLPSGAVSLGLGADYRDYRYEQTPLANGKLYAFNDIPAYDMHRATYGVFAELLMPVIKDLEISAALRYDSINKIDNGITGTTMGEDMAASTYKLSARYQPTKSFLIRGSIGTGFKAPDMLDIAQPLVAFGVTQTNECPFPGTTYCKPATMAAYDMLKGGNQALKPEESEQYTIGFRFEPISNFSFGADLWDVTITNQVSAVSQELAFSNPAKYANLFTPNPEAGTGDMYWAFKNMSMNIGQSHTQGVDWDFNGNYKFDFGTLSGTLSGTYLIDSSYTRPGTDNDWTDSLGHTGENNAVSFRNIIKLTTALRTGAFNNSVAINFRSGYGDTEASVRNLATGKNELITLDVPSYTTMDWQGTYNINKAFEIRAGVKNILNTEPPMSLRTGNGHQNGYDPRYTDPMMRSFYMSGSYKF
ncbi:TonB-dependent receptor plug domain-containing protein [Janthinobacterium sp. B9-8]|uniref:TonB-dependent receptor plug domain-containing protein n=1 Tax=Janthinobacterium sp. B9-8 TaxID=1236179 RepID=UPI00061D0573|nr:TonB-dependent receptor [Janthinobacterium sp. B9-8]AMC36779.1 TonB-dependent receptor [Janthinobacterium sp. B9-8]